MVVGHLAAGLAGKRLTPRTSLVWLIAAPNLVDLVWPLLLLAGAERVRIEPGNTAFTPLAFEHYPWTHSLLMGVVWGLALGAVARLLGATRRAATIVGALVVSHWLLDLTTHRPDLPLLPWSESYFGLGLWNSIPATFIVEGALWIGGIAMFLRTCRPRGVHGQAAFWSFVVVSTLIWASGPYSPPPPDERTLAWSAAIGWIIVPWAWWIEKTSDVRDRYLVV